MRFLFCLLGMTGGLVLGSAAGAEARQSPPAPPANDDCLVCHSDAEAKRASGTSVAVDASAIAASKHAKQTCVACHADLATLTEFPHPDTLKKVGCAGCHTKIGATFDDSIHARAREKSGLNVAPACADCHGTHDIRDKSDRASRVSHTQVPATCGVCHDGIKSQYDTGVHAEALKKGDTRAPVCSDCHTAHAIQRSDTDAWRLSAAAGCGSCHAPVVDSFVRTFHGKVNQLGSARVAACADCHGAHGILPASNAASTVSVKNLQVTCGKCHTGANARFVQYDPHPNPLDYKRSAVLWWANRFYWVLIPACFGFFGLHSVLWFWRSRKDVHPRRDTT